jgi:hypothetical protein
MKKNVSQSQKIKLKGIKVKRNDVKNGNIKKLELFHLIKKAQPQSPMLKTHN